MPRAKTSHSLPADAVSRDANRRFEIDNSGVDPITNPTTGDDFYDVANRALKRRQFLKGSLGAVVAACFTSPVLSACVPLARTTQSAATRAERLGFSAVASNRLDSVTVPEGYRTQAFLPWGTPLTNSGHGFHGDARNTALEQAHQVGSHHDGMHFSPSTRSRGGSPPLRGCW